MINWLNRNICVGFVVVFVLTDYDHFYCQTLHKIAQLLNQIMVLYY